ncbi:hypothetical protein B9Z55_025339 [Caenorhabditis nigoni]|nr:hypothetical protein B9Z55_025339 [Caenorhabditis nigoni]
MSSTSTESWYDSLKRNGGEVDWENFRVTKEQLETWTPSRHDGISHEDEVKQKEEACDLIYKYVDRFPKTEESHAHHLQVTAIASVILHRYFTMRSVKSREMDEVAAGCVMVACRKTEVYNVFEIVLDYLGSKKYGSRKIHYQCELREMMSAAEKDIDNAIGFNCVVTLPHEHLAKMLKVLDENVKFKEIHQKSLFLATELLLITEWTLTHSPTSIAIVCIRMALTAHNLNRAKFVKEGVMSDWFKLFDAGVTESLLLEMIGEVFTHKTVKDDATSRMYKALCLSPTPNTTRKDTKPKTRSSKSSTKRRSTAGMRSRLPENIQALMDIKLSPNLIPKGTQKPAKSSDVKGPQKPAKSSDVKGPQKPAESSDERIRPKTSKYDYKIPKNYRRKFGASRNKKQKDSSTNQNVEGISGDDSSSNATEQVDNATSPEANPCNFETTQNTQYSKDHCETSDSEEGDIPGKNYSESNKKHALVNKKISSSEDPDNHEESESKKSRQ